MIELDVQYASAAADLPSAEQLQQWVQAALTAAAYTEPA